MAPANTKSHLGELDPHWVMSVIIHGLLEESRVLLFFIRNRARKRGQSCLGGSQKMNLTYIINSWQLKVWWFVCIWENCIDSPSSEFDPTQDSPIELLHTILLGVVKYMWHMLHLSWNSKQKSIFTTGLQAMDTWHQHPINSCRVYYAVW